MSTVVAFLLLLVLLEVLSLNSGVAKQQCKTDTTLEGKEKVQTFCFFKLKLWVCRIL